MGCFNSIVIHASSDKVWEAMKNFHDMTWAPNVISKVEKVGAESGEVIGAKRILNDAFAETLLSIDHKNKSFTYSIDDGPGAVSKDNMTGYVGEVRVIPVTADNSTFVLWTSSWKSTKVGGVAEFCNPVYQALLGDLKKTFS